MEDLHVFTTLQTRVMGERRNAYADICNKMQQLNRPTLSCARQIRGMIIYSQISLRKFVVYNDQFEKEICRCSQTEKRIATKSFPTEGVCNSDLIVVTTVFEIELICIF